MLNIFYERMLLLKFVYILREFYVLNETLTYNFQHVIQTFLRSNKFPKIKKNFSMYIFLLKVFVLFYFKISQVYFYFQP